MTKFRTACSCNFRPTLFYDPSSATHRATVAVSACLAGEKVRYDGTDKLLPVYALLHKELNLVSICPEMGAGLGVPRPPIRLVEVGGRVRARGRENQQLDVTSALQSFAALSLRQLLNGHSPCGYIWKSRSPSCGLGSTPLFNATGIEMGRTSGIQAEHFRQHLPHINHCEETALETADAALGFVLRCRLVFDVLFASDASLAALHRHYTFLHENFDNSTADNLKALIAANDKARYLTALLGGCNQIEESALVKLFID